MPFLVGEDVDEGEYPAEAEEEEEAKVGVKLVPAAKKAKLPIKLYFYDVTISI